MISGSPAVGADGTIYVASQDHRLHAIGADGRPKWSYLTQGELVTSPAIDGKGVIYIGSLDRRMYAITATGDLLWQFAADNSIRSSRPKR